MAVFNRPAGLNENQVIAIVRMYLEETDWTDIRTSNTKQRGVDLEAMDAAGRRLCVEAKGATSSMKTSNRYGKPFKRSQVMDHVAKAFYVAARVPAEHLSAIAVPRNDLHAFFMKAIRPALGTLKIAVFWVDEDKVVNTWNWS